MLVLSFDSIGKDDLPLVGGKGANLGEMTRAGLAVPPGFCVTTRAFRDFVEADAEWPDLMTLLEGVQAEDVEAGRRVGQALRDHIEGRPVPPAIRDAVVEAWTALGTEHGYAVRSSATAEDLPDASFAGQQDTYLNIRGEEELIRRVRACWASLYTDRAILYRLQNGIDHRDVSLSVVVQRMVRPDKSGILFTADPLSGHRHTLTIDAGFGLGESLVSGKINADNYRVDKRDGRLLEVKVGDKSIAIRSLDGDGGGTVEESLDEKTRKARVLDDEDVRALTDVAKRIEQHYGTPQDIEWAIEGRDLHIVQSRPITSLYPLPEPRPADGAFEVCICVNHLQVMTDAMPPMAHSVFYTLLPLGRRFDEVRPSPWLRSAGGRVFVNLAPALRLAPLRHMVPKMMPVADPLMARALRKAIERPEFKKPGPRATVRGVLRLMVPMMMRLQAWIWFRNPEGQARFHAQRLDRALAEIRGRIDAETSMAARLKRARFEMATMFPTILALIPRVFAGAVAGGLLKRMLPDHADDVAALGRGLTGNVTTEMDLEVGDLADAARDVPAVRDRLQSNPASVAEVLDAHQAKPFREALETFLSRYGARAAGEIDITRPRYRDDPGAIFQVLAGSLQAKPGHHRAHQAEMVRRAEEAVPRLEMAARKGWLGWLRVRVVRRLIRAHRGLMSMREHPKFFLIRVIDTLRALVLEAGDALKLQGRVDDRTDVWFLHLEELIDALDDSSLNVRTRIAERRRAHERHQALYPPRVLTSDGESPPVEYDADIPEGALAGSPASSGQVEGVARVIRDPTRELLRKGEILVAPYTDPGWTPLFINAAGLVMEVGGLMTHGSVVAREYGIPAVVSVPDATRRIRDGQRIRVHGDGGYVEILSETEDRP